MGKSTEQRIWDRVKIAQLILLAAAFLLFLEAAAGRAPADAAARTGATIQTGTANPDGSSNPDRHSNPDGNNSPKARSAECRYAGLSFRRRGY